MTKKKGNCISLHKSECAWKPSRFNGSQEKLSEEQRITKDLYRNVIDILNKVTEVTFNKLCEKMVALPINTLDRIQNVIQLIHQKAVDEPSYCALYAKLCYNMQNKSTEFVIPETNAVISFRKILINKCQYVFERDNANELDSEKRLAEIKECTDPVKKKELQLLFQDEEMAVRRKFVGSCRFVGELFKLGMLTSKIMLCCIQQLLSRVEEKSLESVCKLLMVTGKSLESNTSTEELDQYFLKMQELSEKTNSKVSVRIRFMLQDVIDLRKNNWVPRRTIEDHFEAIELLDKEYRKKKNRDRNIKKDTRKQVNDPCDAYSVYVKETMRSLPHVQRVFAQKLISDVLTGANLGKLTADTQLSNLNE